MGAKQKLKQPVGAHEVKEIEVNNVQSNGDGSSKHHKSEQARASKRERKKRQRAAKKLRELQVPNGNAEQAVSEVDGYVNGEKVDSANEDDTTSNRETSSEPEEPRKITPDEWDEEVENNLPTSMSQLLNGEPEPTEAFTTQSAAISIWLDKQTWLPTLSSHHRKQIIEHLINARFPGTTEDWPAVLRQTVWRALYRSGHFWVNPETGEFAQKSKPIHRPDGIYENDFTVFVMCAAERADRIGRDLPSPGYVEDVEAALRELFRQVEEKGKGRQLAHLAFLLLADEVQGRRVKIEGMRERVKRAFGTKGLKWEEGCEMFQPEGKQVNQLPHVVQAADRLFKEFGKVKV